MRAGKLRHRISIDEPVTSQNETGEEIVDFQRVETAWGSIEPLNGRERLQSNAITGDLDTRICIRWSPARDRIDAKWRLRHKDVVYNIKSIAHIDLGRREIEFMTNTGLNQG